jgi:hypothetical protein
MPYSDIKYDQKTGKWFFTNTQTGQIRRFKTQHNAIVIRALLMNYHEGKPAFRRLRK